MSQTSLVESSSSGEAPRNALSLRLEAPFVPQDSIPPTKQSYNIQGRYVYEAEASPATPTYHISNRNTQAGNPWQLQICRLLPSEVRRLGAATGNDAFIRYDDDLTLYSGEKMTIPFSFAAGLGPTPLIVIRGQKRGTIQGSIVMEKSGRSCKFYHMIPIKRALTKAEEDRMQALMHKRGYRDSDDWKKKLLLTVQENTGKVAEWTDEYGTVAVEKDDKLEFSGEIQTEKKDLVVACWACKGFVLDKTT
ncbi:uncharacterized protein BKA55DRAFT_559561 [Fusarium redolens]|uniref:Uncharacterized protein n=1 Tax=Fusarium redolens TaxID=48865 RepID=A0A9P9HPE0_FUSRE|nr:uncharacterized protein BKA55DRAFT_559561 [Fusarium redolens]KAH7260678.1 hypothetical protein BKA55DRAFT_559561 [Fusarium redolens]